MKESPFYFNEEKLTTIESWKNFVKGDFFILEHKKDYSILLESDDKNPKVYGVVGLQSAIEEITPPYLTL